MVANVLGGIVGYLIGSLLAPVIGGLPTLLGGIMGGIAGLAQWQTLRDFIPGVSAPLWVAFTGLGFGLAAPALQATGQAMAWVAGVYPNWQAAVQGGDPIGPTLALISDWQYPQALLGAALTGALGGLALGLAQWYVLRRSVRDAWLWIPACALAGIVGTLLGLMLALLLHPAGDQLVARAALILFLVPSGIFLLGSLVTGGALAILLSRLKPQPGKQNTNAVR